MKLTVAEQHQLRIARQTLKMNDTMLAVLGGMTKEGEIIIPVDEEGRGCVNGQEVANTLRKLADLFEAGKRPMDWHSEDEVPNASVDWL